VHLADIIEPFMCGGNAAYCQITLITCYHYKPTCTKPWVITVILQKAASTLPMDGLVMCSGLCQCASHPILLSWTHQSPHPKQHIDRYSRFCSRQRVPMLNNGPPISLSKLSFRMRDQDPYLIHGSLGPTESATQTAYRLVQSFFVWLDTIVTKRQTDRPRYPVCNNRRHLYVRTRSIAMRPKSTAIKCHLFRLIVLEEAVQHQNRVEPLHNYRKHKFLKEKGKLLNVSRSC